MIKYQLQCDGDHSFEAWFRSSDDFDLQAERRELRCPVCDSPAVAKAIMAPAIARSLKGAGGNPDPATIREHLNEAARRARAYVEKNFDYVGNRFPEEARRIHYGETDHRPIYGEATAAEARDLVSEGVTVAPLPNPQETGRTSDEKKKLN